MHQRSAVLACSHVSESIGCLTDDQTISRRQGRKTREVRKQCMYNISDFYSRFEAVFPGIEASSSTLQCTFPPNSRKICPLFS